MDFHTHPPDADIVPSPADFTATMEETRKNNLKQFSCLASPRSRNIHCYKPKIIPSEDKIRRYRQGTAVKNYTGDYTYYEKTQKRIEKLTKGDRVAIARFDYAVNNDFNHYWFDKKTFKPTRDSRTITSDALGARWWSPSGPAGKHVASLDKGMFCERFIQGYNAPNNNKVGADCKQRLNNKKRFHIPRI